MNGREGKRVLMPEAANWPKETAADLIVAADTLAGRFSSIKKKYKEIIGEESRDRPVRNASGHHIGALQIIYGIDKVSLALVNFKGRLASQALRSGGGAAETVEEAMLILKQRERLDQYITQVSKLCEYEAVLNRGTTGKN